MGRKNESPVSQFVLLGFPDAKQFQPLLFSFFLVIYLLTVTGNVLIIYAVKRDHRLHKPMYYLLVNFSFMEICYISSTVPNMLFNVLLVQHTISVLGCITQCYFFFVMGALENYLLALMAYDRYLAICNPLRYPAVMTTRFCSTLAGGCWAVTFLASIVPIIYISRLQFCDSNEINHFFCDISPLLKHSCSDTTVFKQFFFTMVWIIIFSCFLTTLISYLHIIKTLMQIPSTTGRKKGFSTCTSHAIVVTMYYGTVIFVYVRPMASDSTEMDKVVSVFYVVLTPLFNPFIYSLRNKDVRKALAKVYVENFSVCSNRSM
ncbi:olfactory receptor 11H4-like [Ambystoma mexicanum]|uniref:olfactory receptor 11H4-like n=1 Tax=Ambystoma mexicanum TaxID=8296 RepID=UPI0037E80C3D